MIHALGNPVYVNISEGNIHDATVAIESLPIVNIEGSVIQGDRAYGSQEIRFYDMT